MNLETVWSLRLGFSAKQSTLIQKMGFESFLSASFHTNPKTRQPSFLQDVPKTFTELRAQRQKRRAMSEKEQKVRLQAMRRNMTDLKTWWINKMQADKLPLREKMVCFWHNHFVVTSKKIKVPFWIYEHNQILRENAFGNFRELTRKMVKNNAIILYLDNNDNKKGHINENLSRELLELFTLGIGNYTETDIKEGARALAGLGIGNGEAVYRFRKMDIGIKTYLGKSGNFKVDDLVDLIFQQKNIPYLITRKILQWFIYDNPPEELVKVYGDYLQKVDFEIAPFLKKVFLAEYKKPTAGSKIKDPLLCILQLLDELQVTDVKPTAILQFLKKQGMELMNPPNVKGWEGGKSWLTSQIFLQRNQVSDLLCRNKMIGGRQRNGRTNKIQTNIQWNRSGNHRDIIEELSSRLLFQIDENLQNDMQSILKYDFDSNSPNANQSVLRLFNFITKTPEFQLI